MSDEITVMYLTGDIASYQFALTPVIEPVTHAANVLVGGPVCGELRDGDKVTTDGSKVNCEECNRIPF